MGRPDGNGLQHDSPIDHKVAVIGAGFSGMGVGIKLKKAGIEDFVILEQADDIGGTWRDNTYPGLAVDIASFAYSFSFEPNPDWSRVFAPGVELKAYADRCATKYDLRRHLRFNKKVTRIVFDEDRSAWTLHTSDGEMLRSRFVFSAGGVLTQPKLPDIPGIGKFAGRTIHSARWDSSYDLAGKRVAVIGTGATSVQLVPAIAPRVHRLHVFQRTPIWLLPKPDAEIPGWMKQLFRAVPATQYGARMTVSLLTELIMVIGIAYNKQAPGLVRRIESLCLKHLERQVPDPELRAKLTPGYGFGCKRPSFSNSYYRALNRENVELVTEGIERIDPHAIVTRDGKERRIDTLILATGYKVFERGNIPTFEVFGRNGLELGAFWDEHRYQAYEGTSVPGFPNFFMIFGPYSLTGASWFSMLEAQAHHGMRCIREARRRGAIRVEVKKSANDAYFRDILRRQQNTVFFNNRCGGAHSYYFDRHGDAPGLRPSSGIEMWWRGRHFPINHYRFQ